MKRRNPIHPKKFPHWDVNGRVFYKSQDAYDYAVDRANASGDVLTIMEWDDPMLHPFMLQKVHPGSSRIISRSKNPRRKGRSMKRKAPPLGTGARFKALVKKLRKRGARSPKALAAWIGTKRYGKAKMKQLAARGRWRRRAMALSAGASRRKVANPPSYLTYALVGVGAFLLYRHFKKA